MLEKNFGIEVEFTGITRARALDIVADHLNDGVLTERGRDYVMALDGRKWKVVSDGSINVESKDGRACESCELVSPILNYRRDIEGLQELVRKLRRAGAMVNGSCGIHIHLDGADHTARSIRNFVNIVASKNDIIYKALQVKESRMRYCQKIDTRLVEAIQAKSNPSLDDIEEIWYSNYSGNRNAHYHSSRYHFLNLHSFFSGHHTVELRGFNGSLHAGVIRSYIVMALALNNQALTQKFASAKKPQVENEKFAMRTYLNRLGLIGDEFKNCREHLCKHLDGNGAWRFSTAA